ncbi:hypothetical protein [uncultured Paraglaciecola sp.]|uniref:hypothetical protein n=1 Tax=uncultured Paraglaciecola sp. TaxID=1765024 RepID=UPI0030DCE843|tara:strand:+ start:128771 stop:129631 length:861 start_codon:yes stop_codon:yes gene_type:complete
MAAFKLIFSTFVLVFLTTTVEAKKGGQLGQFNIEKDLLLAQFDSKTDVDDIHSIAATATMLADERFQKVKFYAVAGAYGDQEGLYVPASKLFELSFERRWVNAHTQYDKSLTFVITKVAETLALSGNIWIAEAGQSNFTADVIRAIKQQHPNLDTTTRIKVVQHSNWNENSTNPADLAYTKANSAYFKIPDGNAKDNGTPGFKSQQMPDWRTYIKDPRLVSIWELAISVANQYNGVAGRYNNPAIADGGIDFSDVAEICWIFGFETLTDENAFFKEFAKMKVDSNL